MKVFTWIFGAAFVGVLVCLVMTGVTAYRHHQAEARPAPVTMPGPALGS